MTNQELIKIAKEAMAHAYVPYSKFKVGAALLTRDGKVFTGCNVENASFGATNCAERTAIFKAISEGERDFVKLAVVSHTDAFTYPCGICRQVIAELLPEATLIFSHKDETQELTLNDILPYQFDSNLLND
ncbi:MAG: cytidine deaminase [Vallitaleaceae bacterium]|jgi:cytidine deaminase|nr:cytidine deaminase [Vallitaleaceae bacterium]